MKFENPFRSKKEVSEPSTADLAAAKELIEENPLLASSNRVHELLQNDFVTEEGRQVDPGDFLAAMLEHLENNQNDTPEVLEDVIARNMVTHSFPKSIEHQMENRL